MPKNKGKGGKSRRRGKGDNGDDKRELIFKEDGQEYAQVLNMLGNGRLEVLLRTLLNPIFPVCGQSPQPPSPR